MHDIFHSEEQYREYQDDLMGDGFSNEYQRASFQARLENPIRNETDEAARLVKAGKWVVMYTFPYYCRITSGVLGEEVLIYKVCDSLAEAVAIRDDANDCSEDPECHCFLYQAPAEPLEPRGPAVPDFDDEIPF